MPPQLSTLRIRNLALVEDLTWELQPGFTCVTGETGSGKSIILGALKLLVGERADKSLIRNGTDTCTVEALFDCPMEAAASLNESLAAMGVEPCEEGQLLLKRVISAAGTNRQFINGSPAPLLSLQKLGTQLIDLHGPHEHQSLLSTDLQRRLLDEFAGAASALAQYAQAFAEQNQLLRELDTLMGSDADFERECGLLQHQINEIEAAAPQPLEEPDLHARYHLASQGRKIIEITSLILNRLSDAEDAVLPRLAELSRPLRDLHRIDPEASSLVDRHGRSLSELEDLARDIQRYSDATDLDPETIRRLEDRINLLEALKRKYGNTLEDVLAFEKQARDRLQKLSSRSEQRKRIQDQLLEIQRKLDALGQTLRKDRERAAPILAEKVGVHLTDLGLGKSQFQVALLPLPRPGPHGLESVEFLFAPNPGEPPKPMRAIASSGETSRIMLAVKSALAEEDAVALLVFDEIDANVGGEIAHAVGEKMAALGLKRQVLCISHLPQVASKAEHHFVVTKTYSDARTHSHLRKVSHEEREQEVARMLGGQSISALALAKTLLHRVAVGAPQVPSESELSPPVPENSEPPRSASSEPRSARTITSSKKRSTPRPSAN
jgi:DNA repair protein RecN (Recombination protein N)